MTCSENVFDLPLSALPLKKAKKKKTKTFHIRLFPLNVTIWFFKMSIKISDYFLTKNVWKSVCMECVVEFSAMNSPVCFCPAGILDQSAVWVDEMNYYDMRTNRNKGISPLSLRPSNPLGIDLDKYGPRIYEYTQKSHNHTTINTRTSVIESWFTSLNRNKLSPYAAVWNIMLTQQRLDCL